MFSLFDDVQYEFELLAQKKIWAADYEYLGLSSTGRALRVYFYDYENDETRAVLNMSDIVLNVADYMLAYWKDKHMIVMTDIVFLEVNCDFCCLESKTNAFGRVYRISKGAFTVKNLYRS